MGNAPIHTYESFTRLAEVKDYKAVYLPLYSSVSIPVENFWLVIKNSVKRNIFQETEDLNKLR